MREYMRREGWLIIKRPASQLTSYLRDFPKRGEKKKSKTKIIKNRKELDNETQTVIQEHLHFA